MELGSWIGQWRSDLGQGAWFVDRLVKKGSESPELGSWISRWRSDLGRGAWFVDRPVKKGSGSLELGSWIDQWRKDLDQPVKKGPRSASEKRTRWRMKKKERPDSFWEREREREREVICKMSNERERAHVCFKMVVVRNKKKWRRMNILLKYLVK